MQNDIDTEKQGGNNRWKIAAAIIAVAFLQGLATAFGGDVGHWLSSWLD